ncbi:MAG: alanine--tRNA ligase [Clostridia bacterium]|nr:alanine--tRNA ligase [Clostridia bacterium]
MEKRGLNELREMYLSFFESKGHLRLPSYSLIPQGDKSLLLINSGMAPMKKFFTGEVTPPRRRVTTCQKCIRTPDIERVGKTSRHGTYFEMLGNFSFADYFKEEAIPWAWEFLTEVVGLDPDSLHISVFEDPEGKLTDNEAYDIWTKKVGVKPDHMVHLGREDNFWEHGPGPCGPCSEIYVDRGEKYGCGRPDCAPGCDCDRFVEVWNIVFSQFVNDGAGHYELMDHPNIDTGMGLERLACMVQGVDNLFEVDTVANIMRTVSSIACKKYHENEKDDVALRVITDHIRSTTMMIGDGVTPSNTGRGYVLRRLLRRAARYGRLLGIDRPFLTEPALTVIAENEGAYPVLADKKDYILKVISAEEESFNRTVDAGLAMLNSMADRVEGLFSGDDAFKLADTFGFPIDLTRELLEERGIALDEKRFFDLAAKARETARSARKSDDIDAWKNSLAGLENVPETVFTGYEKLSGGAEVLAIVAGGERVEELTEGEAALVLDTTPFYAESGGQKGDTGRIASAGFEFEVSDTVKTQSGLYLHRGKLLRGVVNEGNSCEASVDAEKRAATARNHTAAHLLQAALRSVLGSHVEQAGQLVTDRTVRFDFTHFSAMTPEEVRKAERLVNEQILTATPVVTEIMSLEDAKKSGAMALFGEKYGDSVRVVSVGDFSRELCGGTHVKNTGELGLFKIIYESSVASGVRRIEAVTGMNSLEEIYRHIDTVTQVAGAMKVADLTAVVPRAIAVAAKMKELEREIDRLNGELAKNAGASIMSGEKKIGALSFVSADVGAKTPDELRGLADAVKADDRVVLLACSNAEKGSGNIVCACGAGAVAAGADAGKLVRAAAQAAGGNGGGKKDMAMAGMKDASAIPAALAAGEKALAELLGLDG